MGGKYDGRKIWNLIGLHSNKSQEYGRIGRSFIRSILDSAKDINPQDNSDKANEARKIKSFADLDGINFIAQIEIKRDKNGKDRNEIRYAVRNDRKEYNELMHLSEYNGRYRLDNSKKIIEPKDIIDDDEILF